MNQNFLKNLSLCAIIISFLAVGGTLAQQPTPSPKRNSPFAPNPKKKGDTTPVQQTEIPKKIEPVASSQIEQTSKIESNSEPKIIKVSDVKQPQQIEENKPNLSASGKNAEFQSRSVAKKTLEVAKRASAVEPPPTETYKVGIGDVLFISLQNAPAKESTYFTVLTDGNIDYPLAGGMTQVLGMTVDQIEDSLREKIKLYENPLVSIKIREHNSHVYTVLGLVEKTGEKTMQREAIPLYVVKAEAIVSSRATEMTLKRGNAEKQKIDLKDSKSGDILIYPGDILEFKSNEDAAESSSASQFYFIGGEINSGGRKNYIKGITLTQAILESGGLKRSNVKKVIIRRKNETGMLVPSEFDLKSIKDGKAVDPVLEAGDTIEIGN